MTDGCLTLGIDETSEKRFDELCGPRVLFWPQGQPTMPLATITSSRIGRTETAVATFVEKLQLVLPHIAEADQSLLIVEETTNADLVHRAARQASIPVVIATTTASRRADQWLWQLMRRDIVAEANEFRVFVSPLVATEPSSDPETDGDPTAGNSIHALPLRDRVAVAASATVWNLSLRQDGNLHCLLRQRLSLDRENAASVRLVRANEEPITDHIAELVGLGAVSWQLLKTSDRARETPTSHVPDVEKTHVVAMSSLTDGDAQSALEEAVTRDGEWLIHWTRSSTKPLEGQSADEWLDRQLQSTLNDLPAGPLGTLHQILQDGVIRASSEGLRGSKPMTCFSAVPLRELVSRRRFQTHRARWDFEPYGVCIRRRTLEARGARPVIYGDDSLWQALPEPERPWFQQRFSGRGKRQIDWSEELEWRVAGDVCLSQFPHEEVIVFCRDRDEVRLLNQEVFWPTVSVDALVRE